MKRFKSPIFRLPNLVRALVPWRGFRDAASRSVASPRAAGPPVRPNADPPDDPDALVEELLAQGRYALFLRPQLAETLSPAQLDRAATALDGAMALVPAGEVLLRPEIPVRGRECSETGVNASPPGRVVRVPSVLLDRHPVTNRQFYEFVAGGGYAQVALWDPGVWTAVLEMTDRSGKPGPRFWIDGVYLAGEEDHPVVGVSWYEAAAYARWIGKRLPSEAEWVKAGAWPSPAGGSIRGQRRFPWGGTMDRRRANLWGSGPERVVSVHAFSEGESVGGIHQLIGNVWEWTLDDFLGFATPEGRLVPSEPMKSIRGGAFDTYFDHQATCQFQSAEGPLCRRHNIGFRCALGGRDLAIGANAGGANRAHARPPASNGQGRSWPEAVESLPRVEEVCT